MGEGVTQKEITPPPLFRKETSRLETSPSIHSPALPRHSLRRRRPGGRCPHIDIRFGPPAFPRRQTTFIPCINSLEAPGVDTMLSGQQPAALGGPGHFPVGSPVQCSASALGRATPWKSPSKPGPSKARRRPDPQPAHPRFAARSHTGHPGPAASHHGGPDRHLPGAPIPSPDGPLLNWTEDAAIQTQEEANQKIQAQLDRLLSFHDRIQQEATEENA